MIVFQTKASRLNPDLFGQVLLSMDLIRQRWSLRSSRSVLNCVRDHAELGPIVGRHPGLEVRTARATPVSSLSACPGAAAANAVNSKWSPDTALHGHGRSRNEVLDEAWSFYPWHQPAARSAESHRRTPLRGR